MKMNQEIDIGKYWGLSTSEPKEQSYHSFEVVYFQVNELVSMNKMDRAIVKMNSRSLKYAISSLYDIIIDIIPHNDKRLFI